MRKILSIFICIVLIAMPLSINALAADDVALKVSDSTIKTGEPVIVTLAVDTTDPIIADSIEITFLHNRQLRLISGAFAEFEGTNVTFLPESRLAILTLSKPTEIKGDFFTLTLTSDEIGKFLTLKCNINIRKENSTVLTSKPTHTFTAICSEHKFSEWDIISKADCLKSGNRTRACSVCEFTETEELAALGHNFSAPKITRSATCETAGNEESICSNCKLVENKEIAPTGHEFKEAVITTEPTIGKEGVKTGYCMRCNVSTDSPVPCAHNDKETGIRIDVKKGVYPATAKAKISVITEGSSLYNDIADSLAHISNRFLGYSIDVTNLGFSVNPDGEVVLTFPIPENYKTGSAFYFITDSGSVKKLSVTKSEDGTTATFKFMGNGKYAICKNSYAVDDVFISPASVNGTKVLILTVLILIVCWVFVALRIIKVKNPVLYRRLVPTKSEVKNFIKRHIFIIKEQIKKPH